MGQRRRRPNKNEAISWACRLWLTPNRAWMRSLDLFLFFLHLKLCCLNKGCKQAKNNRCIGRNFQFLFFFTSLIVCGPQCIVFIALTSVCIMSPTRLWWECVGQPALVSGLRKNCAADVWYSYGKGITMSFRKLHFRCRISKLLCVLRTPWIISSLENWESWPSVWHKLELRLQQLIDAIDYANAA